MHCIYYKTPYAVTLVFCSKLMISEIWIRDHLTLSKDSNSLSFKSDSKIKS